MNLYRFVLLQGEDEDQTIEYCVAETFFLAAERVNDCLNDDQWIASAEQINANDESVWVNDQPAEEE